MSGMCYMKSRRNSKFRIMIASNVRRNEKVIKDTKGVPSGL